MYKQLTEEELIRIANICHKDKWKVVQSKYEWQGHDIVCPGYTLQISYMGSIHLYTNDNVKEITIGTKTEDEMRKELQQIMSAYK